MSSAFLAQTTEQPMVEWLAGGAFAVLLDAAATTGSSGWGGSGSARAKRLPTTSIYVRTRSSC